VPTAWSGACRAQRGCPPWRSIDEGKKEAPLFFFGGGGGGGGGGEESLFFADSSLHQPSPAPPVPAIAEPDHPPPAPAPGLPKPRLLSPPLPAAPAPAAFAAAYGWSRLQRRAPPSPGCPPQRNLPPTPVPASRGRSKRRSIADAQCLPRVPATAAYAAGCATAIGDRLQTRRTSAASWAAVQTAHTAHFAPLAPAPQSSVEVEPHRRPRESDRFSPTLDPLIVATFDQSVKTLNDVMVHRQRRT